MKFFIPPLLILLASCTKEYSCETCIGDLLVKSVTQMDRDSFVYLYHYDARYRLIIEDFDSRWGSITKKTETILERSNSSLTKVVYKGSDLTLPGLDSISYTIGYNGRYTYKAATYNIASTSYSDSTVYTYSSYGRIGAEERYVNNSPTSKTKYSYTPEGNLSAVKKWEFKNGNYTAVSEEVYTYDNRPAPLILGDEAIIAGKIYLLSPNNPTTYTYTSANNTYSTNTTYSYNANGKPATSLLKYNTTNGCFTTSYFYKRNL